MLRKALFASVALSSLILACTGPSDTASGADDITQVDQTAVKRQAIGNCWIYATVSWLEALHKASTKTELNASESWLTYWHWYDEIAMTSGSSLETGGSFDTAKELVQRRGVVKEGDFLPSEADAEMSTRQKTALDKVNLALKSGELKDAAARRDPALVRRVLDSAWGLDRAMIDKMNAVFGEDGRGMVSDARDAARAMKIIHPSEIPARIANGGQFREGTVLDAIRDWRYANYPSAEGERRDFWKRVQRALHDEQPVVVTWNVEFNALTRDSRFSKAELDRRGPGRQGGHLTVMHDYQAEVPGLGLLKAGERATREQMDAALADGTKIQFVRVKNSWGGLRPDRWESAAIAGYHDLEMDYMNGPIKWCAQTPEGETDVNNCPRMVTPLREVVLPPGY